MYLWILAREQKAKHHQAAPRNSSGSLAREMPLGQRPTTAPWLLCAAAAVCCLWAPAAGLQVNVIQQYGDVNRLGGRAVVGRACLTGEFDRDGDGACFCFSLGP